MHGTPSECMAHDGSGHTQHNKSLNRALKVARLEPVVASSCGSHTSTRTGSTYALLLLLPPLQLLLQQLLLPLLGTIQAPRIKGASSRCPQSNKSIGNALGHPDHSPAKQGASPT